MTTTKNEDMLVKFYTEIEEISSKLKPPRIIESGEGAYLSIDGKEKLSEDFEEIKWVSPDKIESYFGTEFHPALKEYLRDLG